MSKFNHDNVIPYAQSKLGKKEQVSSMFDSIAFRYDFLNRFLSARIDVLWRKKAIKELKALQPKYVLDVATGTGDVAIQTYKIIHPDRIIGIDISQGMLDLGKKKVQKLGLDTVIELQQGDSETINFSENTFDAITVAFGVRNFENLEKGLSEMYRVLKPGGKLVVLEFSKSTLPVIKQLYNFYMHTFAPAFGKLFAKDKKAYQYLTESLLAFPQRKEFQEILKNQGYKSTYFKPLSLGVCCIYCGSK